MVFLEFASGSAFEECVQILRRTPSSTMMVSELSKGEVQAPPSGVARSLKDDAKGEAHTPFGGVGTLCIHVAD